MGKNRDAYNKAAQAERESLTRLKAEMVGGDKQAIAHAKVDLEQTHWTAQDTFNQFLEDPQG